MILHELLDGEVYAFMNHFLLEINEWFYYYQQSEKTLERNLNRSDARIRNPNTMV